MKKVSETRNQVVKWTFVFMAAILIIMLILPYFDLSYILGVIFGTLIGILNFVDLEKTLIRATRMNPSKAQGYAMRKYFIRYLIAGVVLYVSIQASYINVLGTIVGLLLLKCVVFITNLFNDKNYFKRIFRKEG